MLTIVNIVISPVKSNRLEKLQIFFANNSLLQLSVVFLPLLILPKDAHFHLPLYNPSAVVK